MSNEIYFIWLSQCTYSGKNVAKYLLEEYKSPKVIYEMDARDIKPNELVTADLIKKLGNKDLSSSEEIVQTCQKKRIRIITIADIFYPNSLKQIYDPPLVLYLIGNQHCLNDPAILGVVGTRKPDEYSKRATNDIVKELVENGVTIVSGCALGIDYEAHKITMQTNGTTIGVLGCGLDINYPMQNYALKVNIIRRGGALISEQPPGTKPLPQNFPRRNRIISGISNAVFVTQAPKRSGSLITAELALEQGKEVFCLPPNDIYNENYSGVIKYLRDGAIAVYDATDILFSGFINEANLFLAKDIRESRIQRYELQKKTPVDDAERTYKATETTEQDDSDIVKEQQKAVKSPRKERRTRGLLKSLPVRESSEFVVLNVSVNAKLINDLTDEQRKIYEILTHVPQAVDEIVNATRIPSTMVTSELSEMEILGIVKSHSGSRYTLME